MATGFHANPQIQGTQGPGDTSDEQWRIAGVNCETKAISMADEIEIIIDETGEERRLGSWENPDDFVCAFPTFENTFELWDDQQIRRVITDSNRVPRRKIFGPSWIQNQRSHGSCNGYATAGALSRARYLRGIQDKIILSGAFVYSLINGGRDQGSALQAGLKVVETHGAPPESMVTWNMIYPNQQRISN
jgi:hypothetical protein